MSRRTRSFDWVSAPDEGDAAFAAADIRAWLAGRAPPRDWDGVLAPLRDALQRLSVNPSVQGDPICRGVLERLGREPTLEALSLAVSDLARRADDLAEADAARRRAEARRRLAL